MTVVLGIDPGKKGGFVVLSACGKEILFSSAMPINKEEDCLDIYEILSILKTWKDKIDVIHIEKQHAVSKQGVSSTFTTGYGYGLLIGMIKALGIPLIVIGAKQWQKDYIEEPILEELKHIDISKMKDSKKRSLSACKRLFEDLTIQTSRGRWLDGIADAALIASHRSKV